MIGSRIDPRDHGQVVEVSLPGTVADVQASDIQVAHLGADGRILATCFGLRRGALPTRPAAHALTAGTGQAILRLIVRLLARRTGMHLRNVHDLQHIRHSPGRRSKSRSVDRATA